MISNFFVYTDLVPYCALKKIKQIIKGHQGPVHLQRGFWLIWVFLINLGFFWLIWGFFWLIQINQNPPRLIKKTQINQKKTLPLDRWTGPLSHNLKFDGDASSESDLTYELFFQTPHYCRWPWCLALSPLVLTPCRPFSLTALTPIRGFGRFPFIPTVFFYTFGTGLATCSILSILRKHRQYSLLYWQACGSKYTKITGGWGG